jgi:hypothetical protein
MTSLMATTVTWEIVRWGKNMYSFQAGGNVLCQGLFVERTALDALLKR